MVKLMTVIQNYNDFDWRKYIDYYPDLKKTPSINNKQSAWKHWVGDGMKEKRQFFVVNKERTYLSREFFEDNYTIYITRHMNNEETSKYWKHSYECLRQMYKKVNIVVIDDNSIENFTMGDKEVKDVTFFYSNKENKDNKFGCKEFTKRGEMLPFYYFHTYGTTKYALFLHDSVFIQRPIHDNIFEDDFLSFWSFNSLSWHIQLRDAMKICISKFEKSRELENVWKNLNCWQGTFGGICIVSRDYVDELEKDYKFISIGLNEIDSRDKRMLLERLLSIFYFHKHDRSPHTLFADIHVWSRGTFGKSWGLKWEEYQNNPRLKAAYVVKVWSGRGMLLPGEEIGLR